MKLLFVYSLKFKQDNEGNLYTDGSMSEELWKRYTYLADHVEVVSRLEPNNYTKEYASEKFNRFKTSKKSFVKVPDLYLNLKTFINFSLRMKSRKIIKQKVLENDFIIARLPSKEGYTAVKYASKYNKPYLVEVVGCAKDSLWYHSFKGKLLAIPNYFSMKKAVKNSPFALYVTEYFLQKRYPSKGKSISCSDVLLTSTDQEVLENRLKKISDFSKNRPLIIGTAGAIDVKYKGQEYVIKAMAKLKKQGYQIEYHLVGNGDKTYLKNIAQKYKVYNEVKFLGTLPHEKMYTFYDNIDIYIQPSKLEGLPRALIEAMSRGCPAIGSKVGGIPELLDSKTLFTKGSVNEICHLLSKIDINFLRNQAVRNFNKSKEFNKAVLEEKRTKFYKQFLLDNVNI